MPATRRAVLAGAGASALLVSTGLAAGLLVDPVPDLLRRILTRSIGPFRIDDGEFARFVQDFIRLDGTPGPLEADLLWLAEATGSSGALSSLDSGIRQKVTQFERNLLTEFVLATGISGPPGQRLLRYGGMFSETACSNPFAQLY